MTNLEKLKGSSKEDIARMMCAGTDCGACGVASKCKSEAGGYIAWLDSADDFPGPKDYGDPEGDW